MSFNYEAYNTMQGVHQGRPAAKGGYVNSLQNAIPTAPLPSHYRAVPHPVEVLGDATNRGASTGSTIKTVMFDCTSGCRGVPLPELLTRGQHGVGQILRGASEAVFAGSGLRRIKLTITWPGYHVPFSVPIEVMLPTGHITRGQLGHAVAKAMAQYVEMVTTTSTSLNHTWKFCNRIRFQDLVLLSIFSVGHDVWQVEMALVI
ncbi:hypothetical protein HDZ31DRAFT_71067 [Schizophyllum fasciatum]